MVAAIDCPSAMTVFSKFLLVTLPLLTGLCACGTMKRVATSIPVPPLPKFSTLKKVVNIIPGIPDHDQASADDPKMPFNSRGTLGYGHTLRLRVYQGTRSASKIYDNVVMIDTQGMVDLGAFGKAKVGGLSLPGAVNAIGALFRIGGKTSRPITVHIISVEDTPVVFITGDVIKDEFIPAWEGMTIKQAVTVAGGRRLGSTAHGVYLTRDGVKRYHTSLEQLNREEPEPGDIITLSPDI